MWLLALFHRKQVGPPEVLTKLKFIEVCRMRSTWACFDHTSLIQTRNRAPFFLSTLCSPRNILSKFQNFSQTVLKVSGLAEFIEECLNSEHLNLF